MPTNRVFMVVHFGLCLRRIDRDLGLTGKGSTTSTALVQLLPTNIKPDSGFRSLSKG